MSSIQHLKSEGIIKALQHEHKQAIYYSLIKVLFYNMFLSVGYFQMFKCDRKASSNNVPLEEKVSENVLSFIWYEMEHIPPKPPIRPGAHLPHEFTGVSWADTCLSWRVRLTTGSNQNDGRSSSFRS